MAFLLGSFFIKLDSGNNDKNERSLNFTRKPFPHQIYRFSIFLNIEDNY